MSNCNFSKQYDDLPEHVVLGVDFSLHKHVVVLVSRNPLCWHINGIAFRPHMSLAIGTMQLPETIKVRQISVGAFNDNTVSTLGQFVGDRRMFAEIGRAEEMELPSYGK